MTSRLRAFALERGGLLVLAVLILYVWIAPAHIVDGDNAELVTAGTVGGVPHPSGYPLFVLWLRLWTLLPITAAHAAAIGTTVLGAATMLVLHAACRAWGARPLATSVAVAVFAAAPVTIRQATEAEVFALNLLVVATVTWLAAVGGPVRGVRRAALLALVAGLGMANHMTCVLIAPVGILGVVRGIRESSLRAVPVAVAAYLTGLLPYAYLFVTETTPIAWRSIDSLGDLLHHVLRMDYGGPGAFSPNRDPVAIGDNLAAYVEMLARSWLWGGLAIALAVLALRIARPAGETRWGWALLAASFALAGPLLVMRFNVPPVGVGLAVCHRFHLMSAMLLVIPVAAGLDKLFTRVTLRASIAAGLPIVLFAAIASRSLPQHSPAIERCASNMLRSLPPNAVVMVGEDYLYFGALYRQLVAHERTDVTVVMWGQLLNPDYRARLEARSGLSRSIPADKKVSVPLADDVLARGRPMFVDPTQVRIMQTFPTVPHGILLHVLPRGTPLPPIERVFEDNKRIFAAFDLAYAMPSRDDDYAAHVHERYARVWGILARALAAAGRRDDTAFALEMARTLRP